MYHFLAEADWLVAYSVGRFVIIYSDRIHQKYEFVWYSRVRLSFHSQGLFQGYNGTDKCIGEETKITASISPNKQSSIMQEMNDTNDQQNDTNKSKKAKESNNFNSSSFSVMTTKWGKKSHKKQAKQKAKELWNYWLKENTLDSIFYLSLLWPL